ncbi:MAG: hypothetical protein KC589_10035 [Nanoarchaeota archaeon]|nr:hypothetical protein [Nanoarchaeota archaeon]MCA9497260.1 hypothetical protein [Nanoarchaeota archaeon]
MKNLARQNIEGIVDFLKKNQKRNNKKQPFLLGLSGGVDSTTLGEIISKEIGKEMLNTYTIVGDWISKEFTDSAIEIGNRISDKHEIVAMSDIFSKELLKKASPMDYSYLLGQAITLQSNQFQNTHRTVISGNLPEKAAQLSSFGSYMGELAPFGNFLKCEIYGMAHELGVSKNVIERVPGSGIKDTLTDEELVGVSYPQLEAYLLNVNVIEKDGFFVIEYFTEDRDGLRELCKISKKELGHLEYRLLESARYWIKEGPLPVREINNRVTDAIREGLSIGPLFRPESYSIFPSRAQGEEIGIVPYWINEGESPNNLIENIRNNYRITGEAKHVVVLNEDEKINLPEYVENGVKITTIKRGPKFYRSGP